MKIRFDRHLLLSACQLAHTVVPARDPRPILCNVKISANDAGCTLAATDSEVAIELAVSDTAIEEPGTALLPAVKLLAILREIPDETVLIQTKGQTNLVQGSHAEFELPGEDPSKFPNPITRMTDSWCEITADTLKEIVRRTLFATAAENHRYALTGTLIEVESGTLRLVATDGRRLALAETTSGSLNGHSTNGASHVVPTKALQALIRSLRDPSEKVRISLSANDAQFETDRVRIHTRLVEGRFPPYREPFPKKTTVRVSATAGGFLAAVRQAAIMSDPDRVGVDFKFGKGRLTLKAQGAMAGRSQVEMLLDGDQKEFTAVLDPKFLTEMLRELNPADTVTVKLNTPESAVLFSCGEHYSYLVMPLTNHHTQ